METPRTDPDDGPAGGQASADSNAARAEAAIRAIAAGGNPGAEAFSVSNRFTDDLTERLRARFRRRKRRDPGAPRPE